VIASDRSGSARMSAIALLATVTLLSPPTAGGAGATWVREAPRIQSAGAAVVAPAGTFSVTARPLTIYVFLCTGPQRYMEGDTLHGGFSGLQQYVKVVAGFDAATPSQANEKQRSG
jgi:hypothetical protein